MTVENVKLVQNGERDIPAHPNEKNGKVEKEGRTYCNISKQVAKGFGIAALTILAVALTAALVAGIVFMVFPSGLGVGAALGGAATVAGAAIGAFLTKAFTWIVANAAIVTIVSSVALGTLVVGTASIAIAKKCCKNNAEEEMSSDSSSEVEEINIARDKQKVEDDLPEAAVEKPKLPSSNAQPIAAH